MEFEKYEKKEKLEITGFVEKGKQYDLDITLPDDNRNVVFGIIKDCYGEPIGDAVVKLIEVDDKFGKEERKPVSHTFTDDNGEFVFGPLCPHRKYAIDIWANQVDHVKICEVCNKKGKCLKGIKLDCDDKCKADYKETECECKEEKDDKKDYDEKY